MPATIQMIITDPDGKVADRAATITDAEWDALVEFHKGWEYAQVANPDYDPNGPEDEELNPTTVNIDDRWHIVDQSQNYFERGVRAMTKKMVDDSAKTQLEAAVEAAKGRTNYVEKGNKQTKVVKEK